MEKEIINYIKGLSTLSVISKTIGWVGKEINFEETAYSELEINDSKEEGLFTIRRRVF